MYPFSLGDLDPMARLRQQNPFLPQQQATRPTIQPLAPEEEKSLLSQIGGAALGGVGYVGSALEKAFGGRAIRGALGGKPRELLSVLPFSDTLGITDYNDRVSGKQLLGFRPDDDSWAATLAGIGTEVALDPGTYLTFGSGALTGAGAAAKAAGVLPKTIAGRATTTLSQALAGAAPEALEAATRTLARSGTTLAEQGASHLGGVVGVGLPFMNPAFVLGANPGGAAFVQGLGAVAKGLDTAARSVPILSKLTYSPVADMAAKGYDLAGRYGRALFDNSVMGATTHAGQEAAEIGSAAGQKALSAHKTKLAEYAQQLQALGIPELEGTGQTLRSALEGTVGLVDPRARALVDEIRGYLPQVRHAANDLGVNVKGWQDVLNPDVEYFPRYATQQAKKGSLFGPDSQPLRAVDETVQSGRNPILQGFRQGTSGIEQALNDDLIHTLPLKDARQHLLDNYLTAPDAATLQAQGAVQAPKAVVKRGQQAVDAWFDAKAKTLAKNQRANASKFVDYARTLRAERGGQVDLFANHPLMDLQNYLEHSSKLHGAGEAGQSLLAKAALPVTQHLKPGEVTLKEALETAGLKGTGAKDQLANRLGVAPTDLGNYFVGPETTKELQRYMGGFQGTEATNPLLRGFDALTNLTKAFQTTFWPAFHVRNRISGAIQNLNEGGLGTLTQGGNASKLMAGETIPGAAEMIGMAGKMSDEQATAQLAKEMYAHGVGGHMPNIDRQIVGPGGSWAAGNTFDDFLQRIPGMGTPKSWTAAAQRALDFSEKGSLNPLNITGVGANADIFTPVAAGRQVGDMVEGVNRGSLYLTLRQQGMSAEQAAQRVLAAHFDYTPNALTSFEKTFMRRLVPYYSFTRQNLPYQLQALATAPSSLPAITAKAAGGLRQQDGEFLPEYLGGGLAAPLGEEDASGVRRYLTRLDTPVEGAFEWLQGGPRGTERTIMGALGMLNPLVKGPLEYATQRQFFTGRELPDLYSFTGNPLADMAIMSSPASRFFTTGRTLMDPAKWANPAAIPVNLLTGARMSDIDVNKFRNIAEREWVEERLRGLPEVSKFQTLSLRPGMEGSLSPEEYMLLRLNKTLETRAREAKKRGG